jgi:arylsulfatase A-like enzyme/Flp pilus assembly protein TadD
MRLLFAVAAVAALVWSAAAQPAQRPNILLITLDTVRADRLGAYGYKGAATPHLDRLAAEGIRFEDATSASPLTAPAHAAMLTGQYPGRFSIRNNATTAVPDPAVTLAEALKERGYRTGAFIGAFVVDRAYGFGQGFDRFDADFRSFRTEIKGQVQRRASEVIDPALAWIKEHPSDAPFFAWVHLYDAHAPYDAPPPFNTPFKGRPYDGEIAYVDTQIGRLLAQLRSTGALDRTAVVVIGDHGEALGDHGEEDHGIFLYDGVMRIPWIVRAPGLAPRVVAEQVRGVDLMPTVLALAGDAPRDRLDGEDLAPLLRGESRRDPPAAYGESWYPQLHFGWSRLRSLRVGEWKYIDAPKPELYDLRTDKGELKNVLNDRASVAARLAGELETTERSFGAAATVTSPQPDAETVARLRSLGYIGLAAPSSTSSRGPDPKDKILELRQFKALLIGAGDDLAARRSEAAIARLKRAVALNERAYDAHVMLGSAYQQKGMLDQALGEFEAAALLNPGAAAPHLLAAEALLAHGGLQRAMDRVDKAAALERASAEVVAMRGRIYERAGRGEEALAAYHNAVALNPADLSSRARLAGVAMNLRRFDVAEPHLRLLLERKYQPSRTHFALGKLAEARGDKVAAEAEYRRALAIEPGFAPAREALASLK